MLGLFHKAGLMFLAINQEQNEEGTGIVTPATVLPYTLLFQGFVWIEPQSFTVIIGE